MPKKVMVIVVIAVCSLVGGFLLGNGLIHHAAQKKAQAQQYEEYEDDPVEEEPAKEKVSVVGNKYSANGVINHDGKNAHDVRSVVRSCDLPCHERARPRDGIFWGHLCGGWKSAPRH